MRKLNILVFTVFLIFNNVFAQSKHEKIKIKMKQLATLLGEWNVENEYTARDGSVRKEKGTYEVSWALDSTYFKWESRLTNTANGKKRQHISWITFDQDKDSYTQTYLYSKSAMQIIEHGHFDQPSLIYTTTTKLQLSDGVTELLRNEISLKDPNRLIYRSWAKFDEAAEVNNFTAVITRRN